MHSEILCVLLYDKHMPLPGSNIRLFSELLSCMGNNTLLTLNIKLHLPVHGVSTRLATITILVDMSLAWYCLLVLFKLRNHNAEV